MARKTAYLTTESDDPSLDCWTHDFIYKTGSIGCPDCRMDIDSFNLDLDATGLLDAGSDGVDLD